MKLKIGKLYHNGDSRVHPMVYSSVLAMLAAQKDFEQNTVMSAVASIGDGQEGASYWTKRLGIEVSFCDPDTNFLVLSLGNEYIEVLIEDKVGYIITPSWLKFEELV